MLYAPMLLTTCLALSLKGLYNLFNGRQMVVIRKLRNE